MIKALSLCSLWFYFYTGHSLNPAIPLKIPPTCNIAYRSAAFAVLLRIGPFNSSEIDPYGFMWEFTTTCDRNGADDAIGHFILHKFYFFSPCST